MIEIKSRYGGKVLYTAEHAADVRPAVVEAVANHADLRDADLRNADLRGANLGGADLRGADLGGAYLGGADLGGGVWAKVATTLRTALAAMNDGGRHWTKGTLEKALADGSKAYCAVGSVNATCDDRTVRALCLWLLGEVTAGGVGSFNDHAGTTWEDVVAVFTVAARNAERFGGVSGESLPGGSSVTEVSET